jgi:hypothetical protein
MITTHTPQFLSHVLLTYKAVFTGSGVHNIHNFHVWVTENPHATSHSLNELRNLNYVQHAFAYKG